MAFFFLIAKELFELLFSAISVMIEGGPKGTMRGGGSQDRIRKLKTARFFHSPFVSHAHMDGKGWESTENQCDDRAPAIRGEWQSR